MSDSFDTSKVDVPNSDIDPALLYDDSSKRVPTSALSLDRFEDAELNSDLISAIKKLGWTKPSPVQALCLPHTLKGRDLAGFAQTGTGKTGVFLTTFGQKFLSMDKESLPTKKSCPFAIVLAPTRELAMQIHEDAKQLLEPLKIKSIAVFGGVDYEKQAKEIKGGVDLVVATPGRLKDFFKKKVLTLDQCAMFVCDEVDRMFDMGFVEDVEYFLDKIPENCQKLLFSATTNENVKELAFEYLTNPEYISVNPETLTPENIDQHVILCDTSNKLKVLLGLITEQNPSRAVIFANTKLTAMWLRYKLVGNDIKADLITGDLPQRKRIQLIHKIKAGNVKFLIATDVASRGLHISGITHVFNFDLPDEPANYVHRIGRTARAGAKGTSFSLICEEYGENFDKICSLLGDDSPTPRWFDEKYLEIKDKSGNPFKDNFGVKEEPNSRSSGNRSKSGSSYSKKNPREGGSKSPHSSAKGGRNQQRNKRPDAQNKKRQQNRPNNQHQKTNPQKAPEQKSEVPVSTGGFIKKVFSVFFGKKKK